jgi:hypothetical protein
MTQLNRWQRLWIATGITYLLCILATGYVIMPDRRQIGREMVNAVIEEVRLYDPFAFIGESPVTTYDTAEKEGYNRWEKRMRAKYTAGLPAAGFDRIETSYHRAASDLPAKQMTIIILLILGWLLPMAMLSVLNRTVRWIILGSGEKPSEKDGSAQQ